MDKWISVEDELPPQNESARFLVYHQEKSGEILIARFDLNSYSYKTICDYDNTFGGDLGRVDSDHSYDKAFTHWMPIPEKPK